MFLIVFGRFTGGAIMKHMQCIIFLSLIILIPASALAEDEKERRGYLSVSYGTFEPGSDYGIINGNEWETGNDLTISIAAPFYGDIGRYIGMGFDLHFFHTEVITAFGVISVNVVGVEPMVYFQKNTARIQPYAAIGIGFYQNSLSYVGPGVAGIGMDEGGGMVLKGGIRLFPGKRFYLGGYAKRFMNEIEDSDGSKMDLGGTSYNFELGVAF
jgi:hypothetical protein